MLKACPKKRHGPHRPPNQVASHSLLHAGRAYQRPTACKFPPLTFENPEGYAVQPSDHLDCSRQNAQCSPTQPKKGTAAKANIQVNSPNNCRETPLSPAPQPVEPDISSPPDVQTPQAASPRSRRRSSTLPQSSSDVWHPEKELVFDIDPGGGEEPAAVLVTDTPEHQYGVKVTWRRRPRLMRYLLDRGKLSAAGALVRADLELSRSRANT